MRELLHAKVHLYGPIRNGAILPPERCRQVSLGHPVLFELIPVAELIVGDAVHLLIVHEAIVPLAGGERAAERSRAYTQISHLVLLAGAG